MGEHNRTLEAPASFPFSPLLGGRGLFRENYPSAMPGWQHRSPSCRKSRLGVTTDTFADLPEPKLLWSLAGLMPLGQSGKAEIAADRQG